MSCSSGRVGVGYEGDTCSFTCNTGYELTGSDARTCQSDGSWNGSDDVYESSESGSGSEGPPSCVPLNCNANNLPVPANATVLRSSSCVPLNCSEDNLPMPDANATVLQCDPAYQSQCTVLCDEGFNGDNVTYLCNATSDSTMVDWVAINSTVNHTCQGGR